MRYNSQIGRRGDEVNKIVYQMGPTVQSRRKDGTNVTVVGEETGDNSYSISTGCANQGRDG